MLWEEGRAEHQVRERACVRVRVKSIFAQYYCLQMLCDCVKLTKSAVSSLFSVWRTALYNCCLFFFFDFFFLSRCAIHRRHIQGKRGPQLSSASDNRNRVFQAPALYHEHLCGGKDGLIN